MGCGYKMTRYVAGLRSQRDVSTHRCFASESTPPPSSFIVPLAKKLLSQRFLSLPPWKFYPAAQFCGGGVECERTGQRRPPAFAGMGVGGTGTSPKVSVALSVTPTPNTLSSTANA